MKSIGIVGGRLSSSWRPALRLPESNLMSSLQLGRTRSISTSKSSRASHGKVPRSVQKKIREKEGIRAATLESDHVNNGYQDDLLLYPVIDQEMPQAPQPKWENSMEEEIYREGFFQALADGQPDRVMAMLTDPRSMSYVGSLPQTVFIEALHRLSPAHFVEPIRDLHQHLHSWSSFLNGVKRVEEVFDDFVNNLFTVVRHRTSGGYRLELAEYTHLLDCARAMGNGPLADDIWESMKRDHVEPDASCYTHWMGAKVWDKCFTDKENYRLRMLPRAYKKRRMDRPSIGWQGYQTGKHSVRRRILEKFREMTAAGHTPDEKTYINVFLASARTGHRPGMQHVLQTVWNIDVTALKETPDHSTLPPPTPYEPWSALHPTGDLIFAVAHGLAVNNDIPSAVQTAQFISASYNVPIPKKVWGELLERAYVLSRDRKSLPENDLANTLGKVPVDLVHSIYQAMTTHPLNVEPDMPILRRMIKIATQEGSLHDCRVHLTKAYNLLSTTRRKEQDARAIILDFLKPARNLGRIPIKGKKEARQREARSVAKEVKRYCESPVLASAITAYNHLRIEVYQQSYILKRAAWQVLHTNDWHDISEEVWYRQERPKFQEEWCDFLPQIMGLNYDQDVEREDSTVIFRGKTSFTDQHWCDGPNIPVRRHTSQKLFSPMEAPYERDDRRWKQFRGDAHEWMGASIEPLNSLFNFQEPLSHKHKAALDQFRDTWVEFPEDHPLSTAMNPNGGLYSRLTVLGMIKSPERTVYNINEDFEVGQLDDSIDLEQA